MFKASMNSRFLSAVFTLGFLAGCAAVDGDAADNGIIGSSGAERQIAPGNSLPPAASSRSYDLGIAAVDETRSTAPIGSIVAGNGGQVQKESSA